MIQPSRSELRERREPDGVMGDLMSLRAWSGSGPQRGIGGSLPQVACKKCRSYATTREAQRSVRETQGGTCRRKAMERNSLMLGAPWKPRRSAVMQPSRSELRERREGCVQSQHSVRPWSGAGAVEGSNPSRGGRIAESLPAGYSAQSFERRMGREAARRASAGASIAAHASARATKGRRSVMRERKRGFAHASSGLQRGLGGSLPQVGCGKCRSSATTRKVPRSVREAQ
jgi:hypothetical protein